MRIFDYSFLEHGMLPAGLVNIVSTIAELRERESERKDTYPKYVLRTDEFAGGNYEGIKSMHIADFLLSDEY